MNDLLIEMLRHYGLKEIVGDEDNPRIVAMFAELGFDRIKDDETSWCSAVLNYFCKRLGYERSGSLAARSWLKIPTKIEEPLLGDVVVFWRNSISSWEGHVALYISDDGDSIYVIGGNQSNMLNISSYPKSRILGYRRLNKIA